MRVLGCLLTNGSQRNIVKSSDPETNLSGALPFILLYLSKATYIYNYKKQLVPPEGRWRKAERIHA
jgi:hypothetical protein